MSGGRFRDFGVALLLLCAAIAGAQQVDRSAPPYPAELLGQWYQGQKQAFVLSKGDSATDIHFAGTFSDWEGGWKGNNNLEFTRKPAAADMDPKIPQWAREQIAASGTLEWRLDLHLSTSCGQYTLEGTFDKGKIEAKQTTNDQTGEVVSRSAQVIGTDPQDVTYTRGDVPFHIRHIKVDYEQGQQRIRNLQKQLDADNDQIASLEPRIAAAQQRQASASADVNTYQQQVFALQKQIAAAQPDPNIQLQLDYLNELLFCQQMAAAGATGSNQDYSDAVYKKAALLKQLRAQNISVPLVDQKSEDQLKAMIAALEAKLKTSGGNIAVLDDQMVVAQAKLWSAQMSRDTEQSLLNELAEQYAPLTEEVARIRQDLQNVRIYGDPQLTKVSIGGPDGGVYTASWWDPQEGLADLNQTLDQVQQAYLQADSDADDLHNRYLGAQQNELALGRALPSAIYKSAVAQWGTEVVDFAAEIFDNSRKSGFVAGGAQAVIKKLFDLGKDYVILKMQGMAKGEEKGFQDLGGYVFADPEAIRREVRGEWQPEEDAYKEAKEKGFDIAKQFLTDKGAKSVLERILAPSPTTLPGGQLFTGPGYLGQLLEYVAERHKSVEEFVNDLGGKTTMGTVKDLAKDYVKSRAKAGISDWIEGDAWRDYFAAEMTREALYSQWGAAKMREDALLAERMKRAAARDEIERQYEQNDVNYYQGQETGKLLQKKDYTAQLWFKGAQPTDVEFHLYNVTGKGGPTSFSFNSGCTTGDVDVTVKVNNY